MICVVPFQLGMFCDSTVLLLSKMDTLGWAAGTVLLLSQALQRKGAAM